MRHARGIDLLPDPSEPALAPKGRGTGWSMPHRFEQVQRLSEDDGWGNLEQQADEQQLPVATQVIEEHVRSVLSANDSPDIGFDLSVNPYRGCDSAASTASPGPPTVT